MVCPKCGSSVPDESTFCLSCGTRLVQPTRPLPVNGGGGTPASLGTTGGTGPRVAPGTSPVPTPSDGRQAYALSFRPIVDERLRYRVARWVCERAPVHGLSEVQEGLGRGDFLTFLALTSSEAETALQGIQGLGVAPPLVRLAPATTADMLLPAGRAAKPAKGPRTMKGKDWATLVLTVVMLFIFGLVVLRLFGGRGF